MHLTADNVNLTVMAAGDARGRSKTFASLRKRSATLLGRKRSTTSTTSPEADRLVLAVNYAFADGSSALIKVPITAETQLVHAIEKVCEVLNSKFNLNLVYHKVGLAVKQENLGDDDPGHSGTPEPAASPSASLKKILDTVCRRLSASNSSMNSVSSGSSDTGSCCCGDEGEAPSSPRRPRFAAIPAAFHNTVVLATSHPAKSNPYISWCHKSSFDPHFNLLEVSAPSLHERRAFAKSMSVRTNTVVLATSHPAKSNPYISWCHKSSFDPHFNLLEVSAPSLHERRAAAKSN
ncbi:hypothetical protein DIPPA_07655 [Diplonema papillatum]|nr:hypothetical protein DIPPA_07655 [Diplonema papillatum]